MTAKTRINLTVDFDVYMKMKASPEINISSLVNEYLKAYFEDDSEIRATDEIQSEISKKEEELNKIKSEFIKAKEREKEDFKDRLEKAKAFNQAKRDARVMDFD